MPNRTVNRVYHADMLKELLRGFLVNLYHNLTPWHPQQTDLWKRKRTYRKNVLVHRYPAERISVSGINFVSHEQPVDLKIST